jgi:glycosyltransferase involved in cell wall biosynthesis
LLADYQQSHHGVPVGVVRPPFFFETETVERVACRLPKRYLFHFGNIGRVKGSDVVANALCLAWREEPDLTIVWAGKLPQGEDFATTYPELAAESERFIWLGSLKKPELYNVLKKPIAVVAPSRCDNLPNNVLESLACGVPVIGSAGASIDEVVDDGVHGELVPIEDVRALADSLLRAWRSEPPFDGRAFPALSDDFEPQKAAQALLDYVSGGVKPKLSHQEEEVAQALPA